jgi:hypothetical protein
MMTDRAARPQSIEVAQGRAKPRKVAQKFGARPARLHTPFITFIRGVVAQAPREPEGVARLKSRRESPAHGALAVTSPEVRP